MRESLFICLLAEDSRYLIAHMQTEVTDILISKKGIIRAGSYIYIYIYTESNNVTTVIFYADFTRTLLRST